MPNHEEPQQQSSAINELRELLFKQESARIDRLEELLLDKNIHAKEVAAILAEAVRLRSQEDSKLGEALRPAVENAIEASIAQNPKPLSDALFPVMGPSIRKAINHSISVMMQSLNQTLEHSFSMKGLQWRLDALKTGKSFAEVVMLNTLVYRVEQVFLIHKETGLLLKHLSFDAKHDEDADVVSSMLTAVRDFIQDSFAASSEQETQSLRLGDLEIMIEQGPDTVLAVVCRGTPPQSLYTNMSVAIEDIQHEFHQNLQDFDGDTSAFETAESILSTLMLSDYGKTKENQEKSSPTKIFAAVGLIILLLFAWWGWNTYQESKRQEHWQQYVDKLRQTPGMIITHVEEHDGIFSISGFRDPLSIDPQSLLADFELAPDNMHYHFQAYQALQPSLILKRAAKLLEPPQSVTLSLEQDTLILSGRAPTKWATKAVNKALWIAGISKVDATALKQVLPLIKQVQNLIKPPKTIHLQLKHGELSLSGKATEQWLALAAKRVQTLQDITAYSDSNVVRIDSAKYLLDIAKKTLQPPKGVRLQVTDDKVLHAIGTASKRWIKLAKHNATSIRFIKLFDTRALHALKKPVKLDVLQIAKLELNPPATVKLSFTNGTLTASGIAPHSWIESAKNNALNIPDVQIFADDNLRSIVQTAELALNPPSTVTLTFVDGILTASGMALATWIKEAKSKALNIPNVQVFSTDNLQIEPTAWQKISTKASHIRLASQAKNPVLNPADKEKVHMLVKLLKQALSLNSNAQIQIISSYEPHTKLVATIRLANVLKVLSKYQVPNTQIITKLQQDDHSSIAFSLLRPAASTAP